MKKGTKYHNIVTVTYLYNYLSLLFFGWKSKNCCSVTAKIFLELNNKFLQVKGLTYMKHCFL